MNNIDEAMKLVQECLDDWPYAAVKVVQIMHRLERVKEILQEEQPRVLSFEEAKAWLDKTGEFTYIEESGRPDVYFGIVTEPYCGDGERFIVKRFWRYLEKGFSNNDYGKLVRAWTRLPTSEQRKAAMWHD